MQGPDTAAQAEPSQSTMPSPEAVSGSQMPVPTPDIVPPSPVIPTQSEGQGMASEQRFYDESRAEDPVVADTKKLADILGKNLKGTDFLDAFSSTLKMASDLTKGKTH